MITIGKSDCGMVRHRNEDRFFLGANACGVVDGMGGGAHGEIAAEVVCEVAGAVLENRSISAYERLQLAAVAASNAVYCAARAMNVSLMGAVGVFVVIEDGRLHYVHVGDSRCLLRMNDKVAFHSRTRDHRTEGERTQVTQYFGARLISGAERLGDYGECAFEEDSICLLATDGLHELVSLQRLTEISDLYGRDAEAVVSAMVEAANAAGGSDNITVVLCLGDRYCDRPEPPERWPGQIIKLVAAGLAGTAPLLY